jgi:hypothetical protein
MTSGECQGTSLLVPYERNNTGFSRWVTFVIGARRAGAKARIIAIPEGTTEVMP